MGADRMRLRADLKDRVAVITGGSGIIGSSSANLLAASGVRVALCDIREDVGMERVEHIRKNGGDARYYHLDQSDKQSIHSAIDQIHADYGRIDILMNNAGVNISPQFRAPITRFHDDKYHWNMDVNLHGLVECSRAAIPYMLSAGGGNIINTTSICGVTGLRLQCAFVGSKFAVSAITRSMALEYGKDNIRVNAIAPGSTGPSISYDPEKDGDRLFYPGTDMPYTMRDLVDNFAIERPAGSDEMAGLILYLASDDASYTTGQVICVDGGWTAGFSGDY